MSEPNVALLLFAALPLLAVPLLVLVWRRHAASPRAWALLLGNLLLLSSLLSGVLLAGEVYYRFFYDETDAYQAGLISRRWAERHYATNNFGVRDDVDYTLRIQPGKTRVTVIGDSYTKGHGVADVADRFANLLRRRRPLWDVHVLAEDGLDTGAIADRLRRRFESGYETDVVLYAYCLNDISDLMPELSEATRGLYEETPPFLVRHSYLLNTYYYRLRIASDPELRRYFERLVAAYADERWEVQERRLSALKALVAAQDARLLVATWPFFEAMDDPAYVAIHGRLDAFWDSIGVPHLDLLELFRTEKPERLIVNRHDTHPGEYAQRLAADRLESFLVRSASLP